MDKRLARLARSAARGTPDLRLRLARAPSAGSVAGPTRVPRPIIMCCTRAGAERERPSNRREGKRSEAPLLKTVGSVNLLRAEDRHKSVAAVGASRRLRGKSHTSCGVVALACLDP